MGRTRDHYPRYDTTYCPDQAACARLYHPTHLFPGDHCECCGHEIPNLANQVSDCATLEIEGEVVPR